MKADVLIVGQGLAGSLLAWQLLRRDQRILVVDRDEAVTSSKVAAGLVTPLAGSRFNLPGGLEERLLHAKQFYWDIEELTGERLFHHRKIARLFRSREEGKLWNERLAKEGESLRRYAGPLSIDRNRFHLPHGGFEMSGGGWLDVPHFLEVTRQRLIESASYAIGRVGSDEVHATGCGIRWKNVEAGSVVFCEGWRGNLNRFFEWLPMNPVLGDILDLRLPELQDEQRIVSKGGWLLPLGGGNFRAGSTYRHDIAEESPSKEAKEEITEKLSSITPLPFEVTNHRAAIRPVIRRSQIFMGTHPARPKIGFFNGLGSKGVLNGPWHAGKLAAHLVEGGPLPESADLQSNLV
ncbi:MAG: FAD-binding oxidoreductase [Verrucomicrobiales bacterium]